MQFFKTFLASVLGILVGLIIIFLIFFAIAVSSSSQPEPYIRSNTVLKINLSGDIPTRTPYDPFQEIINPNMISSVSVQSIKENLNKAAADDNIAGVWVETNNIGASWANLESVYGDIQKFKESGKFIYFSTDDIGMNEKAYYLASAADSIFYPPETMFSFDGFYAQLTFYRNLLDKIGVEPEMLREGKYKAVVEPFMNESSSPEYREEINDILETFSKTFVGAVRKRTGKTEEEVNAMLNTPPVNRVQFALENGLIDSLAYSDDVENIIKKRIGVEDDDDLKTVSLSRYNRVSPESVGIEQPDTSDKIAVIYSSGMILPSIADSPFDDNSGITAEDLKQQLNSALEDDDVKSIVIHIDSPGGAATTSDILWHYIKQASEKKPIVASMGSTAASGGFYMAMGADTVVAEVNTITGSIGVANMMFNAKKLFEEHLGINHENLKSNKYADLYDFTSPLTDDERNILQRSINQSYETFLRVVAESRGMTRDQVHEIAQGRVYTGEKALDIGLVDVIGDLDKALEIAAEMAGIDEYNIDTYPKRKDLFETLFGAANTQMKSLVFGWIPDNIQSDLNDGYSIMQQSNIENWMLLPFKIDTN